MSKEESNQVENQEDTLIKRKFNSTGSRQSSFLKSNIIKLKSSIIALKRSIVNFPFVFKAWLNELIYGPGTRNFKKLIASPMGILGIFMLILAIMLPSLPETGALVSMAWLIFFYMALSQSWNIMGGYGGEVDFGHILFVGVGSYTVAVLWMHWGVNIWLGIIYGGFVAAFFAILIGIPSLKLRGAYFAITMLAFNEAMATVVSYTQDFTGGGKGIYIGKETNKYDNIVALSYYAIIAVAILSFIIAHYISYSRLGLSLRAIKESPDGASSIGVNVQRTKLTAFAISGFIAGLAGGVYTIQLVNITPGDSFDTKKTVRMIIMTLLGGPGNVFGPVIGSILLEPLEFILIQRFTGKNITIFGTSFGLSTAYLLVYGVVFIFGTLFLPKGIMGVLEDNNIIKRESLIDVPDIDTEITEQNMEVDVNGS